MLQAALSQARLADQSPPLPRRGRFIGWALAYALVIAYASIVVGPRGMHIVPLDPERAWQIFKATPYLVHGSDQRADWTANLLMLVPLATGVMSLSWMAALTALLVVEREIPRASRIGAAAGVLLVLLSVWKFVS